MAINKSGPIADEYSKRFGYLQRTFLSADQKKQNGTMNSGTVGVNTAKGSSGGMASANAATAKQAAASPTDISMGMASAYAAAANQAAMGPNKGTGPTANWTTDDWMAKFNAYGQAAPKTTDNGTGIGSTTGTTSGTPGTTGSTTGNVGQQPVGEFAADYQKLLTQLQSIYSTPFSFDAKSDPTYLAAVSAATEGAKDASRNTLEQMNERGIVNSSQTSSQLGQIEQKAQLAPLQLLPGIEANAYSRFRNTLGDKANIVSTQMQQLNADRTFNHNASMDEANMSGTWESPEYKALFDQLLQKKAAYSGATPVERKQLAADGVALRAKIAGLTGHSVAEVDKMFGSSVGIDATNAHFGQGGIVTAAAQARADDIKYRGERDTVTDAQWQKNYDVNWYNAHKKTGGSGSGGETYDQILKGNTNRFSAQMMSELSQLPGGGTMQDVKAWITHNTALLQQAKVDPSALLDDAMKWYKDPNAAAGAGKTPDSQWYYSQASEAAKTDPEYGALKTPEDRQTWVINKMSQIKSVLEPPLPPTPEQADSMLNALGTLTDVGSKVITNGTNALKKIFTGGSKKPSSGGGSARAVHSSR